VERLTGVSEPRPIAGPQDGPDGSLRVGVVGGTFDPIHLGHLILAEEARDQLGLSIIYFVTAADPPHKAGRRLAPAGDRLKMVELAIAGNRAFRASRVDIDRPGPHFTVDMVRLFQGQLPSGGELFFLMGYDSLADLPTWYQPAELVAACHLVALTRYAVPLNWAALEKALPGVSQRVTLLDMPELEIASHDVQARIRDGRTIRDLVPDPVCAYIQEHLLYRTVTDPKPT
jgi:nicotinate-nucleotide adenylyltransferase